MSLLSLHTGWARTASSMGLSPVPWRRTWSEKVKGFS